MIFCYFEFAERPVSKYTFISNYAIFSSGLPRTVCESVRLSVEKIVPFVNIFDICFPFGVFGVDIVEIRLSLYYVSAVFIAHFT